MLNKVSKTKIFLAIVSLIITGFVWQQGLKDSLERPSVSFDIRQKESEIIKLALPAIPDNFKSIFAQGDPNLDVKEYLDEVPYENLSDRNKFIWLILQQSPSTLSSKYYGNFNKEKYNLTANYIREYNSNQSFLPSTEILSNFKDDKYLYYLIIRKFNFDEGKYFSFQTSKIMFIKILIIKLIPIFTIIIGSILLIKSLFNIYIRKKINWQEYKPLKLNQLDMILLISGGFVVLGEVLTPLFSITLVEVLPFDMANEVSQSLKIFLGYLFMAIPPLLIIYYQIKEIDKEFIFKKDYFQFNFKPIQVNLINGIKGVIMIIPFVLLTSLLMDSFVDNKVGSNPLLEIVLNNNNTLALLLLFLTTTLLAPLFEEIIFRGVLLPVLARDFGIYLGMIITSFVFALAHLSFSEMPPLFVLGIGLSVTRLISGRLLSSVIMHSLWNGLTFLNLFLLRT